MIWDLRPRLSAMTANAFESDRMACIEAGMDDFISKPIQRQIVREKIVEYLGNNVAGESSEIPRILVVDDDIEILSMITAMLQKHLPACSFKTAEDGLEACALLGGYRPHLVITDIQMPNMNGVAMIQFMKNSDDFKGAEIIVTSACEDGDSEAKEIRKMGVKELLKKTS